MLLCIQFRKHNNNKKIEYVSQFMKIPFKTLKANLHRRGEILFCRFSIASVDNMYTRVTSVFHVIGSTYDVELLGLYATNVSEEALQTTVPVELVELDICTNAKCVQAFVIV